MNQEGFPHKGAYRADAPAYAADALRSVHDEWNLHITPQTAAGRWAGERMDYGLALQGLFDQRNRRAHGASGSVFAGTPSG